LKLGFEKPIPQSRISEIELGKQRNVKTEERGRIARALGTTERELSADLGYTGEAVAVTGGPSAGAMLSGKVAVESLGEQAKHRERP
jgi:hypothetical protein